MFTGQDGNTINSTFALFSFWHKKEVWELECLFIIESYCWSYDGNKFVDTNLIGINSPWNGNLAWRKLRNIMKILYTDANSLITIFLLWSYGLCTLQYTDTGAVIYVSKIDLPPNFRVNYFVDSMFKCLKWYFIWC